MHLNLICVRPFSNIIVNIYKGTHYRLNFHPVSIRGRLNLFIQKLCAADILWRIRDTYIFLAQVRLWVIQLVIPVIINIFHKIYRVCI